MHYDAPYAPAKSAKNAWMIQVGSQLSGLLCRLQFFFGGQVGLVHQSDISNSTSLWIGTILIACVASDLMSRQNMVLLD